MKNRQRNHYLRNFLRQSTDFKDYLKANKHFKKIMLYYDIETFQYNEEQGKENPSKYKNGVYSVAVSYITNSDKIGYAIFNSFYDLLNTILDAYQGSISRAPKIILNAHNGNKYDNHYLRHALIHDFKLEPENLHLKNANEEANVIAKKLSSLTRKEKSEGVLLEKRIKSQNNLEIICFLAGLRIETIDNFMKTNVSLKQLGYKLQQLGKLTDEELKQDETFDYTKYNKKYDMAEAEANNYSRQVFNKLTDDELLYIRNDVIILAKSVLYYSEMFYSFDYSKITFTSNILEKYNDNNLTSFQLLNRVVHNDNTYSEYYTSYSFHGENFHDYLKPYYRGGLNFYNENYLDKIINEPMIAIDINSSYPYAMHNFKIPTYLTDYQAYSEPKRIKVPKHSDDKYTLYRMTKQHFDSDIISKIDSRVLRQMIVKYYTTTSKYMNINSYTIKMLRNITNNDFETIHVDSYVTFECEYFGSRDKINEFYYIKTQGKAKMMLDYKSPYNIKSTEKENDIKMSPEEVANSKVLLNGLYGIPALRPYFNLFRYEAGDYFNIENGYKNAERNIVFSIFVTSVALWNLLDPLAHLTQSEIDNKFVYCDTDSLYLKKDIEHKLPENLFDKRHLGKWDYDAHHIEKFCVINHKKYAYQIDGNIKIKAAGIPDNSFNTSGLTFEQFINQQFSVGQVIQTTKSIMTEQKTIAIYPSTTELKQGYRYDLWAEDDIRDSNINTMLSNVRASREFEQDHAGVALYVESPYGTFGQREIYPIEHDPDQRPIEFLKLAHSNIKKFFNRNT